MGETEGSTAPSLLDEVALLEAIPAHQLVRGQVGTVVEVLDGENYLVEFSDVRGRAYAIAPCPRSALLVLRS
jgi:hypothetical protein